MKRDDIDLLALHLVGGRQRPERSRALPKRLYGDPARNVEFEAEIARRAKAKKAKKSKRKGK